MHAEAFSAAEVMHGPAEIVRARFSRARVPPAATKRGGVRRGAGAFPRRSARASSSSRRAPRTARIGSAREDAGHPLLAPITMVHRFYTLAEAAARALGRDPDRAAQSAARSRRRADADICRRAAVRRRSIPRRLRAGDGRRRGRARSSRSPRAPPARLLISAAACWRRGSSIGRSMAAAAICSTTRRRRRRSAPSSPRIGASARRRWRRPSSPTRPRCSRPRSPRRAAVSGFARRACRGPVHRSQPQGRPSFGAHPQDDEADARRLMQARRCVVTLAPASAPLEFISGLAASGIVVSLGHSEASAEEARACFDAGVRCVTHLFNAMSALGSREPGVVGAALDDSPKSTPASSPTACMCMSYRGGSPCG